MTASRQRGEVEYIPVVGDDAAIAARAEAQLITDRADGLNHFLFVRTDTRKWAEQFHAYGPGEPRGVLQCVGQRDGNNAMATVRVVWNPWALIPLAIAVRRYERVVKGCDLVSAARHVHGARRSCVLCGRMRNKAFFFAIGPTRFKDGLSVESTVLRSHETLCPDPARWEDAPIPSVR